ncbi:HAD-IA family hydrolase [Hoyosella subflava]|uniref:5-nucleotidase n=1 Tax=Hoyosella subflava (strain DSM 45089 / JCM 17490 / NBRC 109087 / DQS3-9A1) TaxID=443218 RepID=F6EEJ5_HOYSD|nr:HAD-IA family hydrolase [Hoyosella subflava]AEF39692.1 5-nucleotidase [Hoyosella subflava DQS3-9A1]
MSSPQLLRSVVLFDLDGTITDSAPGVMTSFLSALEQIGKEPPAGMNVLDVVGPPMIDTLTGLGLQKPDIDAALAAYHERYDSVGWSEATLFAGIQNLLVELDQTGARIALSTSKAEKYARRMLDHFDIGKHFEFIGGASNDGKRRRKADVIRHTLENLGVSANGQSLGDDIVMVGDRVHDITGAKTFGIPTAAVTWGYGPASEHREAQWTVDSAAELRDLLLPAS